MPRAPRSTRARAKAAPPRAAVATAPRIRVVHVAAEGLPFSKTGGLADVVGALPTALSGRGVAPVLVLPAHARRLDGAPDARRTGRFVEAPLGAPVGPVRFEIREAALGDVRVLLLDEPRLFGRPGLYGDEDGRDYPDNGLRFAAFAAAAERLAGEEGAALVHAHDWPAALVPVFAAARAREGRPAPFRTVLTVHNLAYQGVVGPGLWPALGLPAEWFAPDGLEFYGQIGFLKGGLLFADALTTVSPTYAREVLTPEHGVGLDGVLRQRAQRLRGILNGIDTRAWDPATDPHLACTYEAADLGGKAACKADLQHRLGLAPEPATPLAAVIARLVEQKGVDLLLAVLPAFLSRGLQLAVLGEGEPRFEHALRELARAFPGRAAVRIGVDLPLAHRIEAGADLFLMPSRYEPCGLNQMYSLRYGTVPVVRATGGLADTVVDAGAPDGTGYVFGPFSTAAFGATLERALEAFGTPRWRELQRRGMELDFSWNAPAEAYVELYRSLAPVGAAAGAAPEGA